MLSTIHSNKMATVTRTLKCMSVPNLIRTTSTGLTALDTVFNPKKVFRNLSPTVLYEHALQNEKGTQMTNTGALSVLSGSKTGRSPLDKRVVVDEESVRDVWWRKGANGSPNYEIDQESYASVRQRAINYLNTLDYVYILDGYANWDTMNRVRVRVVTEHAYHAMFMHNMLIRVPETELGDFDEVDFTIYNAGAFSANKYAKYMTSDTSVSINLNAKEMVILGTKYAGEMKKGVFSYMHYLMPKKGILSLHSGCNVGKTGDVTLFFGLSGSGKTSLSTDPRRPLIGDDEHCWGDSGVFNIEGGCYAKCIGLRREHEPEIFKAVRYGALLENVIIDDKTRVPDYESKVITENTRVSYPIEYIDNATIPCTGGHPKNIIMLCCDAYGVLPPVSKLTKEQAMYHFINGYTSKVAGTEMGITEPQTTFSACYGAAFLMWHPMKYAMMLSEKMEAHGTQAWLVNTGWTGGGYGIGTRMKLAHTRCIIDAIHNGELQNEEYAQTEIFNLSIPQKCTGVPSEVLNPSLSWDSKSEFQETLSRLATKFQENFMMYSANTSEYINVELVKKIESGGPN